MNRMLLLIPVMGFLLAGFVSFADAQGKTRIIHEMSSGPNVPIAVVGRQVGHTPFDGKKGIVANQDWLNHLTFEVKNVSKKTVTYFEMYLRIPPTGKMMSNGKVVSIYFGDRTEPALASADPNTTKDSFLPGEVVTVQFSASVRTHLENYLRQYDAKDVDLIEETIREVHFGDGTGWSFGIELRQDPLEPTRWIPIIVGPEQEGEQS